VGREPIPSGSPRRDFAGGIVRPGVLVARRCHPVTRRVHTQLPRGANERERRRDHCGHPGRHRYWPPGLLKSPGGPCSDHHGSWPRTASSITLGATGGSHLREPARRGNGGYRRSFLWRNAKMKATALRVKGSKPSSASRHGRGAGLRPERRGDVPTIRPRALGKASTWRSCFLRAALVSEYT